MILRQRRFRAKILLKIKFFPSRGWTKRSLALILRYPNLSIRIIKVKSEKLSYQKCLNRTSLWIKVIRNLVRVFNQVHSACPPKKETKSSLVKNPSNNLKTHSSFKNQIIIVKANNHLQFK